jgi:O-antigen/teichoic acid export membrane protein
VSRPVSTAWGDRTRRGVLWSGSAFLGGRVFTFLSTLVLARLLTPGEFGIVAAVLVYLSIIEVVSNVGFKATVVFEQEEGITERLNTAFTANLLFMGTLVAVALAAAPLAAGFFGLEGHVGLFRLGALNGLITALGNIHDSLLLRSLDLRRRMLPQVVGPLVRGLVSIILVIAGLEASALVIGFLAGSTASTCLLWMLVPFRPRLMVDRATVRSMIPYGTGAMLLEVVAALSQRIDVAVIGRVLGERALGLYVVAYRLPELMISSVAWNVSTVAFPALSRKRAEHAEGLLPATLQIVRYQALYAWPTGAGMAILSVPLVLVLFGDAWRDAAGVVPPVALGLAVIATAGPIGDALKAVGYQRRMVALAMVTVPIRVVAIIAVADRGIVAVAFATAATGALYAVLLVFVARSLIGLRPLVVASVLGPAAAAAAGVTLGAGAVRLLLPTPGVVELLLGVMAGALGGVAALRLLPGSTLRLPRRARMVKAFRALVGGHSR